jgi:UDP-N-acetylglucosamine:LPS N-acetylglucosamine transferase
MAQRPTLFFATIAAGGGHVATAKAMMEAVETNYPDQFALIRSDYMAELGELEPAVAHFDRQHKESWKWALRYPVSARLGQRIIDTVPRLSLRIQKRLLTPFALAAARDLSARQPALVISNHGLITAGLSLAKRRFGLRVPVLTFATEPFCISAYWADPDADYTITPTEETRLRLIQMGVPADRLEVIGYPVGQAFLQAPGKHVARRQLDLPDQPTLLVSLGGEGIGQSPVPLLSRLTECRDWTVIVICGRNDALKNTLARRFVSNNNLRILGFVDIMAQYLAASDVVLGKAGPASVFEALAVGRPVLVQSYAGLNEWGVIQFVQRRELGAYVPAVEQTLSATCRYFQTPHLLSDIAARCATLDLPTATTALARRIVAYLEGDRD